MKSSPIRRNNESSCGIVSGISAKFRMPRSQTDQNMLAAASAVYAETEQYEHDFIAYEMDRNFRANLLAAIEAFAESLNAPGAAIDEKVSATARLGTEIRRGMIARRILDGIVKNKYRSNVGKLAAWLSASHIEKPAKREAPPEK